MPLFGKAAVALLFFIITTHSTKIEKGTIFLKANAGEAEQSFKVDINSNVKSELILTQSSKINIEAKVHTALLRYRSQLINLSLSSFRSACATYNTTTCQSRFSPNTTELMILLGRSST